MGMLVVSPPSAVALNVTLTWQPNLEPDLAGYRVYLREEGESFDYDRPEWEGLALSCRIEDLDEDTHYYFVVTAFDVSGNESDDSTEMGLPILLLSPREGSNVAGAPTCQWTPGPFDLYRFCTVFYYSGIGYRRADFWASEDLLVIPPSWWDSIEPGHPCYWNVVGVDAATRDWEAPTYGTFTKIE
jgi:hypothetical protein